MTGFCIFRFPDCEGAGSWCAKPAVSWEADTIGVTGERGTQWCAKVAEFESS